MFNIKIISCFILSFLFAFFLAPIVTYLARKLGVKQSTLVYVEKHEYKSGTPTMGGWIFLLSIISIGLIFIKDLSSIGAMAIYTTIAFGLVGFIDDFIKVYTHNNQGLKAYQKIIAQLSISVIVAFYCYKNSTIGSVINIPFFNKSIDLKCFYIPFVIFIMIATTNSVNLTDGLDGLATKTSIAYFTSFLWILTIMLNKNDEANLSSLIFYDVALLGGLFAFLWVNAYPAKIFMGDTGSLALGAGVSVIALFSKNPLLIIFIGIMYVVSSISVIMQVISFKLRKKRIFKMAPFHHHLEYKGVKESKIVSYYTIITIIAGIISLYSFLK